LAVPTVPSSPGDVQERVIEFWAMFDDDKLEIAAGGVISLLVVVDVVEVVVAEVVEVLLADAEEESAVFSLALVVGPTIPVP
jgi:hypothetical protein